MEQVQDEQKQEQRTFLRERFLRMLGAMTGLPATVKMHEKTRVTCQLGPSDVDFHQLQVTDLHTPMGVIPHAILRTSDIVSIKVTDLAKVSNICRIHARLFDHRSAFQGHINFFAKEFEEKRGDREKVRLDQMQEKLTDTKDHTLPNIEGHFKDQLQAIRDATAEAENTCKAIIDAGKDRKSEFLETQRAARQHELDQFMQQQCIRSARVDQQFEENVKLFRSSYEELKQKLYEGVPFSSQTYYKFMALGKEFN